MRYSAVAAILATGAIAQQTTTDFLTEVVTVLDCPETVTNCPAHSKTVAHVTTNIIPVPQTTSTVYSTQVKTITSCGPEVTNCPAHSTVVKTETIAVSTTVCPVTATHTGSWGNSTVVVPPQGSETTTPGAPVTTGPWVGKTTEVASQPATSVPANSGPATSAWVSQSKAVTTAAPACPTHSVTAITKSYTTVLTSVEYSTIEVPCPTAPAGGNPPVGTAVPSSPVTGGNPPAGGNGTTSPPVTGSAASFTGSAVFALIAGVAAYAFA